MLESEISNLLDPCIKSRATISEELLNSLEQLFLYHPKDAIRQVAAIWLQRVAQYTAFSENQRDQLAKLLALEWPLGTKFSAEQVDKIVSAFDENLPISLNNVKNLFFTLQTTADLDLQDSVALSLLFLLDDGYLSFASFQGLMSDFINQLALNHSPLSLTDSCSNGISSNLVNLFEVFFLQNHCPLSCQESLYLYLLQVGQNRPLPVKALALVEMLSDDLLERHVDQIIDLLWNNFCSDASTENQQAVLLTLFHVIEKQKKISNTTLKKLLPLVFVAVGSSTNNLLMNTINFPLLASYSVAVSGIAFVILAYICNRDAGFFSEEVVSNLQACFIKKLAKDYEKYIIDLFGLEPKFKGIYFALLLLFSESKNEGSLIKYLEKYTNVADGTESILCENIISFFIADKQDEADIAALNNKENIKFIL